MQLGSTLRLQEKVVEGSHDSRWNPRGRQPSCLLQKLLGANVPLLCKKSWIVKSSLGQCPKNPVPLQFPASPSSTPKAAKLKTMAERGTTSQSRKHSSKWFPHPPHSLEFKNGSRSMVWSLCFHTRSVWRTLMSDLFSAPLTCLVMCFSAAFRPTAYCSSPSKSTSASPLASVHVVAAKRRRVRPQVMGLSLFFEPLFKESRNFERRHLVERGHRQFIFVHDVDDLRKSSRCPWTLPIGSAQKYTHRSFGAVRKV